MKNRVLDFSLPMVFVSVALLAMSFIFMLVPVELFEQLKVAGANGPFILLVITLAIYLFFIYVEHKIEERQIEKRSYYGLVETIRRNDGDYELVTGKNYSGYRKKSSNRC